MKQKIFISTIIALCSLLFIGNTVFAEDLPAGYSQTSKNRQ